MRIFFYTLIILILSILPIFVKGSVGSKILLNFFLSFVTIALLINIEFFGSPNYSHSQRDILIYFINCIFHIVFCLISFTILFLKPKKRKKYYFFFPVIAALIVFIFTSFDGIKYSLLITGNILLAFLPLHIFIYYFRYIKKKD